MFCSKCGQALPDGAQFCANCGTPVGAASPLGAAAAEPPPSGTGAPQAPQALPTPATTAAAAPGAVPPAGALLARIIARAKALLLTPRTEWPVIAGETSTAADIYLRYVAPLVAIGVVASFIGTTTFGISMPLLGTFRVGVVAALTSAILHFLLTFASIFLIALIVDALAPSFGGQKDPLRALKVAAYSFTPAWVAAILTIIPALGIIAGLLGLYGLYLLYLGLPVLMRSPADKSLGYTVVVVICAIVLSIVISMVTSLALGGFGMRGAGMLGGIAGDRAAATADASRVLSKALGGKTDADTARMNDALSTLQKMGEDAERAQKEANATGRDPGAAAANAVDVDKAMAAVGAMMAGGKQVEPVDFHALKALLPESLPGMPRTSASAERGEAMGVKASNATAEYGDGANAHITLEIADIGSMSGLAGLAAHFDPSLEKETDTGYERTRKVDGKLMHEKYDRRTRSGETNVLVDNRFNVTARGSGVDDTALATAIKAVDLGQLAKLTNVAGASK